MNRWLRSLLLSSAATRLVALHHQAEAEWRKEQGFPVKPELVSREEVDALFGKYWNDMAYIREALDTLPPVEDVKR